MGQGRRMKAWLEKSMILGHKEDKGRDEGARMMWVKPGTHTALDAS